MYTLCMCVCLLCVNVLGKNTLPTLLCFGVGVMQHPHLHQDTALDPRHQHSSFSLQSPNCASVTWLFVLSHLLHWLKANKFSLLRFLNICVNSSASSLPGYPWHICFYHIPCSNLTTVTLFRVSCRNIDIPDFWMTSVPSAHTVTQSQFCRCFEIVEGIIIVIAENRHHYSTGMIHEKSYSNMEEISNSLYKNYKFVPFSSQLLTTFCFIFLDGIQDYSQGKKFWITANLFNLISLSKHSDHLFRSHLYVPFLNISSIFLHLGVSHSEKLS